MQPSEVVMQQSFDEYTESRKLSDAYVDGALQKYGIEPADEDTNVFVSIGESITRSKIHGLLDEQQKGADETELFEMKRAIIIDSIANEHFAIDSSWIEIIEEAAPTSDKIVIDEAFIQALQESQLEVAEQRKASQKYISFLFSIGLFDDLEHPLSGEEARAFIDSLTPAQRQEFEQFQQS